MHPPMSLTLFLVLSSMSEMVGAGPAEQYPQYGPGGQSNRSTCEEKSVGIIDECSYHIALPLNCLLTAFVWTRFSFNNEACCNDI